MYAGDPDCVGPFGVSGVFGLATGDNGVLYAVAGTNVYTVNTTTGAATNPVDFGGHGLFTANGQSFFTEAGAPVPTPVPEPATLLLIGGGGIGLMFRRLRSRSRPPVISERQ